MIVVVMGVGGSGKTTIGERLAQALGAAFIEGDTYHPPGNIAKMRRGVALEDADRWPWLRALACEIAERDRRGEDAVLACSALKRSYRRQLAEAVPDIFFVHLDGAAELIEARLRMRAGHFLPPTLLSSQLAALEPPGSDEPALSVDIAAPPDDIVATLLTWLRRDGAP